MKGKKHEYNIEINGHTSILFPIRIIPTSEANLSEDLWFTY